MRSKRTGLTAAAASIIIAILPGCREDAPENGCGVVPDNVPCEEAPLYSCLTQDDLALLVDAWEGIESYRKGDLTLLIVDGSGDPLPGLTVRYEQLSHDFRVGAYFDYDPPAEGDHYPLFQDAGINTGTVMLDWQRTQPETGNDDFYLSQARTTSGVATLRDLGWDILANGLVWMWRYGLVPQHAFDAAAAGFDQFLALHNDHVRSVVSYFADDVAAWNVINEPYTEWTNCFDFTEDQIMTVIDETARIVRQEDPGAVLLINLATPTGQGHLVDPHELLDRIPQGAFDAVGLQLYFNGCLAPEAGSWPQEELTLAEIDALLDAYGAHGKDLYITEIGVPSGTPPYACSTYGGAEWTPELQAAYLDAVMLLAMSKPRMRGFLWFDAEDAYNPDGPFVYRGGLLDDQFRPKPSFETLRRRMECWTTAGEMEADEFGSVSFSGFAGEYRITLTDPDSGASSTHRARIYEQTDNSVELAF